MAFSVLIPAFNAAAFVEEALDSVAAQTCAPAEIIVVDDGSEDGTGDVVERWSARSGTAVRLIRQANQGVPVARNRGMSVATSEWIALLDADDIWLDNHLAVLDAAIRVDPDAVAAFGDAVYFAKGKEDSAPFSREKALAAGNSAGPGHHILGERLFEAMLPGLFLCPSAATFRRTMADSIGGFDERIRYIEDRDFFLRLSRRGAFVFADRVITRSRVHDQNITHPRNAARNAGFMLKLLTQLRANAQELGLTPRELELTDLELQRTAEQLVLSSSSLGLAAYFAAMRTLVDGGRGLPVPACVRGLARAAFQSIQRR